MTNQREASAGFSLVEVTLALGIAVFAFLAIFGLLPVGLNANQGAIRQTEAANILSNVVADLRSTPTSSSSSSRLGISIPAAGGSNSTATYYMDNGGGPYPAVTTKTGNPLYRATINVTPPATGLRTATLVSIVVGYPALSSNPTVTVSAYLALDRN